MLKKLFSFFDWPFITGLVIGWWVTRNFLL